MRGNILNIADSLPPLEDRSKTVKNFLFDSERDSVDEDVGGR